jgi:hypothetical protein
LRCRCRADVKPAGNPPRFPEADKKLAEQTKPPSSNWLLDANDDTERFRRLQIVASGTDIAMWEIAHRFKELHVAVARNNWEMGVYHFEKLRDRMNTAGMKRQARTHNIEAMFLKSGVYQDMHDALTSKDNGRMRTEFQRMRSVCMGCHSAENVRFLNDSAVCSGLNSSISTSTTRFTGVLPGGYMSSTCLGRLAGPVLAARRVLAVQSAWAGRGRRGGPERADG